MIYVLGSVALFIFTLFMFARQIRLALIGMRHGKYSYRYVRQFKKYANKSPFPYCFKDDIMPYLRLSGNKKENADLYTSEKKLCFEELPYHYPIKEIMNKYGKLDCFNAFIIKGKELRAYGFKKSIFGARVNAIFFTIDDSFVMGEYIIDDLAAIDIRSFSKSIRSYYDVMSVNESLNYKIDGQENTSIYFYENGFSAIIRYSDNSNVSFQELIK